MLLVTAAPQPTSEGAHTFRMKALAGASLSRFAALTKVAVPGRRRGLVSRRRLLDAMYRALGHRLLMVLAPPGYGKTALVSEFAHELREHDVAVCWLALDQTDADPRTFFEHLMLSVRQQHPTFGEKTALLLRSVEDVGREVATIATVFCSELAEQVSEMLVLIFDDYHALQGNVAVNEAVDWLLERLPESCNVVIAGRQIPMDLDIARLAARMEVFGLGVDDLRFSDEETAAAIRGSLGLEVDAVEAQRLTGQAEGWITAILLSLQADDSGRFAKLYRPRSDAQPVYEYLASEVMRRLPATLQRFLLESAVLSEFSAEECDAVLQRTDSLEHLAEIIRAGLFIEPLADAPAGNLRRAAMDAEGSGPTAGTSSPDSWYRYHQLWREFLLWRLKRADPLRLALLHQRAAERAESAGDAERALDHLLQIPGGRRAAALVATMAERELLAGRADVLLSWLDRLPREALESVPSLVYARARALSRLGRTKEAYEQSRHAERVAGQHNDRKTVWQARALSAETLAFLGRRDEAASLMTNLLLHAPVDPPLRARLERSACSGYGVAGRYRESIAHGVEAQRLLRHVDDPHERLHIEAVVRHTSAIAYTRLGEIDAAQSEYRAAEALWGELGNVTQQARLLNGLALLEQQRGRREAAQSLFVRALVQAERVGHTGTQVIVLVNLARCRRELHRLADAHAAITRALPLARELENGPLLAEVLAEAGFIGRRRGELDEARLLLTSAREVAQEAWTDALPFVDALLALVLILTDEQAEARRLLLLVRPGQHQQDTDLRLRCELALVAAHAAGEQPERAVEALRGARRWARDRGVQDALYAEAAQHVEVARLLVGERGLPAAVRAALQVAIDLDKNVASEHRRQPALRAVPHTPSFGCEIRLFGVPTALRDGLPLRSWGTTTARDVFGYLALREGNAARTEAMADALLPEASLAQGLTAVRKAVFHLRRLLSASAVLTVPDGYCLTLHDAIYCDAVDFQRLLTHAYASTGAEGTELLEVAVACYRGPFMDGVEAEWVLTARAEMERLWLAAAQTLLNAYAQAGRHQEAVSLARRVVTLDELLGDFHIAVLRHLLALGQYAAVRQHFAQYAQIMRDELGEEPADEAIRLRDAATGTPEQPVPGTFPRLSGPSPSQPQALG